MAQTFHRYRAGDKPVGGYKLIKKLGEGGFGEVWQASAPGGAEVALKFIDLTGQQGFREFKSLRLVKKITHNNLTPLHGFWLKTEDGTLIDESDSTWSQAAPTFPIDPSSRAATNLATAVFTQPVELIVAMGLGKQSLYDRLRECQEQGLGGIPADELLDYMRDAAKGIDYLNKPRHDLGNGLVPIVHSDIKPHNILIVGDGAQVCDFGLAQAVESLRKTCAAPLTLAYAAPESFRGKPCDKSDQYSLAITYIELRTGSLPFDDSLTGYEVMTAHVQGQLDFSRLTPGEAAVIRRATAILPQDRWGSSRDMVEELRKCLRLSSDSNYVMDAGTPGAPAHPSSMSSTPTAGLTMMPPGLLTRETSVNAGLTPANYDPTLRTRTPGVAPVIVPGPPQAEPYVKRGRMSTGARLLASLLFLVLFGGGALVAFRNDLLTSWFQDGEKRNTNDEEAERQKEAERLAAAQKEKERKAEEARQQERDRNQPTVAFEAYRDSNQFQKALDVLKQTPAAFVPADEDDLRARWQNLAGQRFLNGNYRDAAKQYEELAAEFGDDARIADWKLMIARARIALRQDARNLIEPLTPPQKRDTGRDRIFYLVKLIVDTKAGKDLDRVDQLYQVWNEHSKKNSQPTPATDEERLWTATDAERAELNSARGAVINHWFENTDKRRDEKSLATLDQLVEMEPDNVDLWIAKADLHLDLEEPEEAAEALRRRAVLKDAPEWMADRAFFLDTYYALKDPKADEERITAALQNVQTLMAQFAERRVTLAKALRELADRDPKHLTQVVQSLRRDAEEADADRELKTAFAELLKQDIQKRLSGETRFRDIARDLLKDCTFVAANSDSPASVPEFVRACHAECLLELRQGDPQQVLGSAGTTPYYHYVRARVFSRAGNAQEVNASLKQLFANPAPSLKSWTERLQTSVGLVDDIADQVRGAPMEFKVEQLLTQPVDESAPARETLTLLRNAYQWVQPSLLSAESRANLAIASWWMKGNEDQELARKLSEEIVRDWLGDKSGETSQPRLAFSLYHAFLAAHQDTKEPAIEDLRIEAARRLIQVCSSRSLDDRDAAQFYQRIVEPLEALAQTQRKHEFFAEAAGLIALYPRFDWKFSAAGNATLTMAEKLDQLYTRAIEASEKKIAAYFKGRADARLMRQPLDYAAIRGDANVLKDSEDFQAHGYAVEGHILYHQARYSAAGLEDRLKSLNLARSALLQAEKLARQAGLLHKDELGRVLYFLSLVHLERGNFGGVVPTGDRTEIIAKKEFEQARDYAEAVIAMGGGPSLQYAYEAAANAYEDLAWHAGESAEANFYKAVDHLRNSVAFHRDSPLAHAALARCYYKMVAEKHVNPPQLRSTYAGHLEAARQALKDAIALPGGDKDPETHLWLGKVIQATYVDEKTLLEQATAKLTEQDYRAADEEFSKALEAAKKARLSPAYLATYAVASAEHAFLNPVLKRDFNSADPKAKTTALNTIHVRCDQLAALEGAKTLRMDPPQEARILRAKADLFTKTPMAVLDSLEQRVIELSKLPESDLTRSDVKLVEFRLGLHAQLQPHQTTKELVESAILDALWYSKAPIALVAQDKVRVLLNAMRLSQQRALKDSVVTAVDQQVKCVQRIIDLKLGSQFDINRHREVITACANGLAQANTEATKAANQKLRQVTRAYIQQALKSADERNRPAAEIKVLNDFLAAIPQ